MKRLTLAIAMAALVLFAGCKKETETTGTTIKASIEQCKGDGSKTTIVPDGTEAEIRWTAGDKILVNNGTTSGIFTLVGAGGSISGTFSYNGEYTFGDNNVAVYPAENTTISGNTVTVTLPAELDFDANKNGANPMLGKITNPNSFSMTSLCGVLGISLKAASGTVDIKAVEVVSNSSTEKLNGTFTVDANATEDDLKLVKSGDDGTNSVRLNCNAQLNTTEAQSFYFALPVGALSTLGGGFTLNVYGDGTDPIFTKTSSNALIALNWVNQMPELAVTAAPAFDPYATPLTFQARTNDVSVEFVGGNTYSEPLTLKYSTDGVNWPDYDGAIILANEGDIVQFRGTNSFLKLKHFYCSDQCYIYGNVMSLLHADDYETNYTLTSDMAFTNLFYGNTNIDIHPYKDLVLPAETLVSQCYDSMFQGCTSLTKAPALPAETLDEFCYFYMFSGCTGLTTAPTLSATTLAEGCCMAMFSGCTGLTTTPALPVETLAAGCYASMFSGCTSLTTAPALPATTLAEGCYGGMFSDCTGLTTAPALTVETLAVGCYSGMFSGCTSLTTAPALPATTLAEGCYAGMFSGCTDLTTAPVLSAATLAAYCYGGMFSDCSSLNNITCLATSGFDSEDCTLGWVYNVAETGTFIQASGASWTTGDNGIPSGWTVETDYKFSVSPTKTVRFAPGNLQATTTDNGSTWIWSFATNQYDYVGDAVANTAINGNGTVSTNGTVDLFGWSTAATVNGIHNSTSDDYSGDFVDWGNNAIANGGNTANSGWRTLTKDEWVYLFNTRTDAASKKGLGKVNGVNGIILLPDEWTLPSGLTFTPVNNSWANVYTTEQWAQMEAGGAVFLPAAGNRQSTSLFFFGDRGYYWSSTADGSTKSYLMVFAKGFVMPQYSAERYLGHCVRLVHDNN